jgi:NAD(P)-dependent dehydrogenase (short-subunit alcohol dehydrogenase family)
MNDRIVVITGANRGIGRAIAKRFLAAGATCVLTVRGAAAAAELSAELGNSSRAHVELVDVRDQGQIVELAATVRERFGRVDVLVNNAAVFEDADRRVRADEVDVEVVRRTFDVNVLGTIAMCVAMLPLMRRGAHVVNLASDLGQFGQDGGMAPTMVAYSMSKAAVNAYTSALANAVRDRGVYVDSLHPGWVKTAMGGPHAEREPSEAADAVYALASREGGETGRFWIDGRPAPW